MWSACRCVGTAACRAGFACSVRIIICAIGVNHCCHTSRPRESGCPWCFADSFGARLVRRKEQHYVVRCAVALGPVASCGPCRSQIVLCLALGVELLCCLLRFGTRFPTPNHLPFSGLGLVGCQGGWIVVRGFAFLPVMASCVS